MRDFLDTSALVKIYHKEEGSEKVLDFYNYRAADDVARHEAITDRADKNSILTDYHIQVL